MSVTLCSPSPLPPAGGFQSLDSGVVSPSARTHESGPAHRADPWMQCSDWNNPSAAPQRLSHPLSCFILTALREAGRAVILSSYLSSGRTEARLGSGEMVHFTCISLKVTQSHGVVESGLAFPSGGLLSLPSLGSASLAP